MADRRRAARLRVSEARMCCAREWRQVPSARRSRESRRSQVRVVRAEGACAVLRRLRFVASKLSIVPLRRLPALSELPP